MGSCASTADPKSAQQKPASKEGADGAGADAGAKKPLRFSYFPVHHSGLGILLTLEAHTLPWDANSVGFDAWGPMKASGAAPFDRLPILETDDAGTIAETIAILRYLGRRTESEGKDELEKVRASMLLGLVEEMRADHKFVQPTVFDKTKDAEKCKEYWEKTLPAHLDKLEKFLDGKDRVTEGGKSPTEFHLWSHLHQLLCLQGGSDSMKEGRPHLHAFYTRIDDLDSTKNVVSGNSPFGGFFPFYLTLEQAAAAAADTPAADGEKSADSAAPAAAADAAPAEATKGEEEAAAAAEAPKEEEAKAEEEKAPEGQEEEKVVPVEGAGEAAAADAAAASGDGAAAEAGAEEAQKEEGAPAEGAAGAEGAEKTEAEKAETAGEAKAEGGEEPSTDATAEGKKGEETVVEPVTEIVEENK